MSKRIFLPVGISLVLLLAGPAMAQQIELRPSLLRASPGARAIATAVIARDPGSQGEVYVGTEGTPEGITVEVEHSPTLEDLANLHVRVAPGVSGGDYAVVVRAWSLDGYDQATQLIVQVREPQPTAVEVDPGVLPSAAQFPPLADGLPRPLARIVDPTGRGIDFIANELILSTADPTELDSFRARSSGEVVGVIDPGAQGVQGLATQYLVRIDPNLVDPSALLADLAALDANPHGLHRVSSQDGYRLLAAFGREAASGRAVGVNWVAEGTGYNDRKLADGPKGWIDPKKVADVQYTPNAFDWKPFQVGGGQNIGVAEAWRALSLAGKLPASVKAAIIDGGFKPYDLPSYEGVSVTPSGGFGSANLGGCGGHSCPWHGTNVAQAGFGVPGNGVGAAGPGGPVSKFFLVHNTTDIFTNTAALLLAAGSGARVINMSFTWRVPALLTPSVWPFNWATWAVRSGGTLIIASAGNDNEDVDQYKCFGACWEVAWHSPCENDGVMCVGGIAWNSKNIAWYGDKGGSNYGYGGDVDLFAPWTVYGGVANDVLLLGADARWISGTSMSAPFVAGVATLIWAADPSQTASDVAGILIGTSHPSPDAKVKRYVNALGAVKSVLGGNVRPLVTLDAPATGASIGYGGFNVMTFTASAEDFEDGNPCCTIRWTSSVDGVMGSGTSLAYTFPSPGTRVITATATDSAGGTWSASITVHAINGLPVPVMVKPNGTLTVYRGVPFDLEGRASDPNQLTLPCSSLKWHNVGGEAISATGCMPVVTYTTSGFKALRMVATDEYGLWDWATFTFSVVEPPAGAPIVSITSPSAGAWLSPGGTHTLSGTASDPDGDTALTYTWSVVDVSGVEKVIGTGASVTWTPSTTLGKACGAKDVTLRLRVTDSTGATGTAIRAVVINYPPC